MVFLAATIKDVLLKRRDGHNVPGSHLVQDTLLFPISLFPYLSSFYCRLSNKVIKCSYNHIVYSWLNILKLPIKTQEQFGSHHVSDGQNLKRNTYSSVFSSSSSPQAILLSAGGLGGVCAFIRVFLFVWCISPDPLTEDLLLELLERLKTKTDV